MNHDDFGRTWIIENGVPIVESYAGNITIRALYYRLVADHHMPNNMSHYKKVVGAMKKARWDGNLTFDSFVDHEREQIGITFSTETDVDESIDYGKNQIKAWMNVYKKNRWENQNIYPEIWIEKKALISAFQDVCKENDIGLCPCKGYPSLTFLDEAKKRFSYAETMGQIPTILYFGDYDPSGEDIPRSIKENIGMMGVDVDMKRILLMEEQVIEMGLPPAPTKVTDSRSVHWNGLGQVELDAIEPRKLGRLAQEAIDDIFDEEKYNELIEQEEEEKKQYRSELKDYVKTL